MQNAVAVDSMGVAQNLGPAKEQFSSIVDASAQQRLHQALEDDENRADPNASSILKVAKHEPFGDPTIAPSILLKCPNRSRQDRERRLKIQTQRRLCVLLIGLPIIMILVGLSTLQLLGPRMILRLLDVSFDAISIDQFATDAVSMNINATITSRLSAMLKPSHISLYSADTAIGSFLTPPMRLSRKAIAIDGRQKLFINSTELSAISRTYLEGSTSLDLRLAAKTSLQLPIGNLNVTLDRPLSITHLDPAKLRFVASFDFTGPNVNQTAPVAVSISFLNPTILSIELGVLSASLLFRDRILFKSTTTEIVLVPGYNQMFFPGWMESRDLNGKTYAAQKDDESASGLFQIDNFVVSGQSMTWMNDAVRGLQVKVPLPLIH